MPHLLPGGEPFFLRGGPVGALLVHGFTGAPREMRPVGEALAGAGCTVLGVRLAHHGTAPGDMFRSRWSDWFNSVVDGYHILRDQCPVVFAAGLSLGGALSLCLAAHYPLAGVAALSTPSQPFLDRMDWRARFARPLSYLIPYVAKGPPSPDADPGHVNYERYPVRAVAQLRAALREVAAALPAVKVPVLLIHSRGDASVGVDNLDYLYQHVGSADKERLLLERGGHIITEGVERAQVLRRIVTFVAAHTPDPYRASLQSAAQP